MPKPRPLPDVTRSHHGGHPESEAANELIQPSKEATMWKIIVRIAERGPATADEVAAEWECSHNHVAPRISEAKSLGLLAETPIRRVTRSGCTARVIELTDKAREILRMGCPETGQGGKDAGTDR
jgi:hypothetical protein